MTLWQWLGEPPGSTIFILCVSVLLSLLMSLINRAFTGKEELSQLNAWRKEITAHKMELLRARRAGDKQLLKQLQKRDRRIRQIESKVNAQSMRQIKIFPITMVLFLVIWMLLTGNILFWNVFVTPFTRNPTVARFPWLPGTQPLELKLFQWYFLCSIVVGALLARIFGYGMEAAE